MKAIIAGAGITKHLGYPLQEGLSQKIIPLLNKHNVCPEIISLLESTKDVELVMTHLDLILYNNHPGIFPQINIQEIREIRKTIKNCLTEYFINKDKETKLSKELIELCRKLNEGDCIITLNYDLMFEKSLLECKMWNPRDGYGFSYDKYGKFFKCEKIIFDSIAPKSKIFLYKLHGSINWTWVKQYGEEFLYIYTPAFCNNWNNEIIFYGEPKKLNFEDVLIEPTFIKVFNSPLIEIWKSAYNRLQTADRVIIIGCNLNEADSAFCMLLSSALLGKSITIEIINYAENDEKRTELEKKYKKYFRQKYNPYWCKFEEWINDT